MLFVHLSENKKNMSTNLLPRLSLWARGHRPLAIALLIALKMVLGAVGFYSGIAAALLGYTLPKPSTVWMLGGHGPSLC